MKILKAVLVKSSLSDLEDKLSSLSVKKLKTKLVITSELSIKELCNKIESLLDLPSLNKEESAYFPLYFENVRYSCYIETTDGITELDIKEV